MKHSLEVTLVLVGLFLAAQVMGLFITHSYMGDVEVTESGEISITWQDLPSIGGVGVERPQVEPSQGIWLILIAIIIGTILLFLIIKMKHEMLWRVWFFLAVAICLTIAFAVFIGSTAAFFFGFFLAYLKVFRPSIIIQNFTELFVYGGLAAIFVPMLNKVSVILLLFFISLYDMYAVWKSKHMIKLAKFQAKAKIFAGMMIPYSMPKIGKIRKKKKSKEKKGKKLKLKQIKIRTAILGGGDVGFPLIFAGVIMKTAGLWKAMIIPVFVSIALLMLLMYGRKDKFYPAMPFLSIGCLAGYAALYILELFL